MKENRKLLKEVLKDIRHDMTDEEVLDSADICTVEKCVAPRHTKV